MERAEDIARILDVHLHHLLEDPTVDESTACSALLAAMGVAVGDTAPDAASVTEKLAFDDTNPSSIVSSLVAARANARGISEVISSEMWEALNVTYNALALQVELGRQEGPHGFFGFVRERAALLAGLADSTICAGRCAWCISSFWVGASNGSTCWLACFPPRWPMTPLQRRLGDPVTVLLRPRGIPAHLPA